MKHFMDGFVCVNIDRDALCRTHPFLSYQRANSPAHVEEIIPTHPLTVASNCISAQTGYFTRALRAYKLGIRLLDGSVSVTPAADSSSRKANSDAQDLFITLLLNASLCLLRLLNEQQKSSGSGLSLAKTTKPVQTEQLMRPCIATCRKAIYLDQNNAKAWFRLAQAYAALHDYEEACKAGERSLALLDAASKTKTNVATNPLSRTQVSGLLDSWRSLAASQQKKERQSVRRAFLRRLEAIQRGEVSWNSVTFYLHCINRQPPSPETRPFTMFVWFISNLQEYPNLPI
ncbi:unnamed protein product [Dibothriocephalus latus]|uniref:Uncharacterized protein n=1 Tax=Dibothriocephalus latus TaxID=60516 RepID=A0A3P7P394_DIBLA|nr:unnamed protein product [Dibothriocephalus latus]